MSNLSPQTFLFRFFFIFFSVGEARMPGSGFNIEQFSWAKNRFTMAWFSTTLSFAKYSESDDVKCSNSTINCSFSNPSNNFLLNIK